MRFAPSLIFAGEVDKSSPAPRFQKLCTAYHFSGLEHQQQTSDPLRTNS
jgi:hypothetical protein